MKFTVYNFVIFYHLKKNNSADALLKQFDYKKEKQMMNHFLLFLQQKLAQTEDLKMHEQFVIV